MMGFLGGKLFGGMILVDVGRSVEEIDVVSVLVVVVVVVVVGDSDLIRLMSDGS